MEKPTSSLNPAKHDSTSAFEGWDGKLLEALADQAASALEQIEQERAAANAPLEEEREKLRAMLLSSVSHDLKTPLAGIIGALSAVLTLRDRLPAERREDLLETALDEAYRLDAFITNILDMARLENGDVQPRLEWRDMESLLKRVQDRLAYRLRERVVVAHPLPKGVEIHMDATMMAQALRNVMDNACKYTPPGARIELAGRAEDQGFFLDVRDHGDGLPESKLTVVFDKYARLRKKDFQVAGTGLGLSICKALMRAQGGEIAAANHPEGGAVFTLFLPAWRKTAPVATRQESPIHALAG